MISGEVRSSQDRASWLLLPCVLLALSGVTLLAPRHAAQAAPPPSQAASKPPAMAYDDGDGDELLEHWDSPKYADEERVQMVGAAAGFLLLGIVVWGKRSRRPQTQARLTLRDVSEPAQPKTVHAKQRKAA